MSEVASPDGMRSNRTESGEVILYLGFSGSGLYLLSVHILLVLICWLDKVFSFLDQCKDIGFLHESSGTFVRPSK